MDQAIFLIGDSYFGMETYKDAIPHYSRITSEFKNSQLRPKAQFKIAESYYNLSDYTAAIKAYQELIDNYPTGDLEEDKMGEEQAEKAKRILGMARPGTRRYGRNAAIVLSQYAGDMGSETRAKLESLALGAQGIHRADDLVARDDRQSLLPEIPFDHVQIRAADRAAAHSHADLSGPRLRNWQFGELQGRGIDRGDVVQDSRFHAVSSRLGHADLA